MTTEANSRAMPHEGLRTHRVEHIKWLQPTAFSCLVQLELRSIEQSQALLRDLGSLTNCVKEIA